MQIAEELSVGPVRLRKVYLYYLPTFQTVWFCWVKLCFLLKAVFLHLKLGTIIAVEIGQAAVDLKLEVKWELALSHYHCHGVGSNTRYDDFKVNAFPVCESSPHTLYKRQSIIFSIELSGVKKIKWHDSIPFGTISKTD